MKITLGLLWCVALDFWIQPVVYEGKRGIEALMAWCKACCEYVGETEKKVQDVSRYVWLL